ncbi:hypothetical protein CAC42_3601 [Sphaceloma murrayae]|uniref:Uncharacterized protein n=1 Tax=Sphaceloma murrayae TaxID=2082308 RepID=A0A2K1QST5_9PEZI|nr:hypothetical protein CAC42_3601 [Sphaceloma murrayae]
MYSTIGRGLLDERPIIFFDSHPEPPAGIVRDSLSRFTKHLKTAWTGDVVIDVQPGMLRLQWYTTDGNFGKRDYELREHAEAQTGWETICNLPDVARAMIVGYPSQNPYSIDGKSQYAVQEMRRQEILRSQEYRDLVPRKKKEPGVGDRIEDIIMEEECREKRLREGEERRRREEGKVEEV